MSAQDGVSTRPSPPRRVPLFRHEPQDAFWLTHAGSLIAAVAAVSIGGSALYELGFLHSIGLTARHVPISLADYTKTAFQWVPMTFAGILIMIMIELFTRWTEDGRGEDQLAPPGTRLRAFRDFSRVVPAFLIMVLGVVSWLVFGELATAALTASLSMLWLGVGYMIVSHPRIGGEMRLMARRVVYYVPAAAISIYGIGWDAGFRESRSTQPFETAVIRLDQETATVRVLRMYEAGLLYAKDDRMVFSRWDTVESIGAPSRTQFWRGFMCRAPSCVVYQPREPGAVSTVQDTGS